MKARNARLLAYRPKDAADMIGLSKSTIYQMIKDGKIQSRKIGGATVICHDELTRILDGAPLSPTTKAAQASMR